ncbi:EthD domain-containing protein [Frankia sp. AgKG'84/4]|uniref:EthD domain-containing protein n=1 Tax=Frankia sp. AgKG'84/4 TaxID=573490 RepID=UPI00200EA57E|nr:EthD domain-containing protein [Frankia sp. AgKG'84/4]MCL9793068.1 EthD domain-containing protein [Frankia sp. AgKG'84/4]
MEKVVFVAYQPGGAPALGPAETVSLNRRLLRDLDAHKYPGIVLQLENHEATERWQGPRRPRARRLAAVLAVWTESGEDVGEVTRLVGEIWPDHAACVVTEAVVRWWTGRRTSPTDPRSGCTVTAVLYRSPSLTHDQFERHWIDTHQPMSLRIHPQHTYVRNVVARGLAPAAPQFDAISEEGFASVEDVLEPERFFGADVSDTTWQQNATAIGDDVQVFLDSQHTVAALMHEYWLRDLRPPDLADPTTSDQNERERP